MSEPITSEIHYATASGFTAGSFPNFWYVGDAPVGSGWKPANVVHDAIISNPELLGQFMDGRLRYENIKGYTPSDAAINNFVALLGDTGSIRKALGGEWTKQEDASYYIIRYINILQILLIYLMI